MSEEEEEVREREAAKAAAGERRSEREGHRASHGVEVATLKIACPAQRVRAVPAGCCDYGTVERHNDDGAHTGWKAGTAAHSQNALLLRLAPLETRPTARACERRPFQSRRAAAHTHTHRRVHW